MTKNDIKVFGAIFFLNCVLFFALGYWEMTNIEQAASIGEEISHAIR